MNDQVEYRTTNGHTVLMHRADWDELRPLLEAGLHLQSLCTRGSVSVILREYSPPRTMLLSKALAQATERDEVWHLNGDLLDHRRANLNRVRPSERLDGPR